MKVKALDHIVLKSLDVSRSLRWYMDVLDLEGVRIEEWQRGEAPFPSVRIDEGTLIDLFEAGSGLDKAAGNLDHFCLVLDGAEWQTLVDSGSVQIVLGPVEVFGARGMGESVYTHDPDGNTVELRRYPE